MVFTEATASMSFSIAASSITDNLAHQQSIQAIEKDEEIAELKTRLVKFEQMQTILVKKIEQIESSEQMLKVQIVNSENNNQ
jgi:hypothetical protein